MEERQCYFMSLAAVFSQGGRLSHTVAHFFPRKTCFSTAKLTFSRSFVIVLIRKDYRNQIFATLSLCLENGVMMTPKRRLSTLIFACLCFKKSFLIKIRLLDRKSNWKAIMRGDRQIRAGLSLTHSLMKSKFCRRNVSFAMADVYGAPNWT